MAANEKVINLVIKAQDQYSRVLKNAEGAISALGKRQQAKLDLTANIRKAERDFAAAAVEAKKYAIALKAAQAAGEGGSSATRQLAANLVLARGRAQEAKAAAAAYTAELRNMRAGAMGSFKTFSQTADAMDITANATERLKTQLARAKQVYADATTAAERYNIAQRSAPGLTNARNATAEVEKARAAKIEIIETQSQLQRLNGTTQSTFLAFSRAADGMQLAATEALDLAPATQQVVNASNQVTAAQKAQKAAMDATTASMRRQASTRLAAGGRGGFDQGVKGERQEATLFGLKPYQLTNLAYQGNDIISGLAMGQAPVQILAQQLGQVLQIFPSFTKLFFTAIPAVTAFAVAVGLPVARLKEFEADLRNFTGTFQNTLNSMADGGQYTSMELTQIAFALKDVGFSAEEARDGLVSLVRQGIRSERLIEFMELAREMSALTGEELPNSIDTLSAAFTGGFDGLRDLDKEMNLFTAAQLESIRAMYDSGDAAAAQDLAFSVLEQRFQSVQQETGAWSRAFSALGTAWDTAMDRLSDTQAIRNAAAWLDLIAKSVERLANGFTTALEPETIESQIAQVTAAIQREMNALDLARQMYEDKRQAPTSNAAIDDLNRQLEILKNQKAVQDQLAAIDGMGSKATGGFVEDMGTEAYQKRVGDLAAELAKVNEERQRSTALIGEEGRLAAESIARQEAEALAKQNNVSINDAKVQAEIQGFVDVALAAYDAEQAAEAFGEAEKKATGFIEGQTKAQENWRDVVEEMLAIRAELVAKYGQEAAVVRQLDSAMAQFTDEMSVAEGQANSLAYAASNLAQALASLGSFDADLTTRLATAERKIQMAQAGYSQARIEAEAEVNAQTREANRILVEEGKMTFDQVAAGQAERIAQLEKVKEAEERAQTIMRERFNPKKGGGGSKGDTPAELQEKKVNDLLDYRVALLERIEYYTENGNTKMSDELRVSLEGVNIELQQAIDGMIKLLETQAGPEAQTMLLEMKALREEIITSTDNLNSTLPTAIDLNEQLAGAGVNAFDAMAQAIAAGEDAAGSFFDMLRQGFAEFLLNIAKAIAQQALLSALQGGGGASGGVGGLVANAIKAMVLHDGGIAGRAGSSRMVNPAIFANAMRYHTGGMAGLKPNEVPAVLERNEEVLPISDPRHSANGGGAGANIKIVNSINPADVVSQGMQDEAAQQVMFNFITRNSRQIRSILGS